MNRLVLVRTPKQGASAYSETGDKMGRAADRAHRAVLERRAAGADAAFRNGGENAPTKAELRASIPAYDESMVKRIETPVKGKRSPKR
jgi:hypothetical protein